jgi:hypothetical protein
MASKTKQQTHPLVSKLVPDPGSPGDIYPLVGYLAPSSRSGHLRIYHSQDFSYFTDVPEEAILHTEARRPGDENSPSVVYVKGGARVHVTRVESHVLSSRYLAGEIARSHLPGAAGPGEGPSPDDTLPTCLFTRCATCEGKYD